MNIGAVGQSAGGGPLSQLSQATQSVAVAAKQNAAGPNVDRVELSPLSGTSIRKEIPEGKPQMYRLFTEEIEAAIGRIESVLRNSRFDKVTGSMMETQKKSVINEPEKGHLHKIEQRLAEDEQRVNAQKAQQASEQNQFSPAHGSLRAVVDRVAQEQNNRNAQGASALQMLH